MTQAVFKSTDPAVGELTHCTGHQRTATILFKGRPAPWTLPYLARVIAYVGVELVNLVLHLFTNVGVLVVDNNLLSTLDTSVHSTAIAFPNRSRELLIV